MMTPYGVTEQQLAIAYIIFWCVLLLAAVWVALTASPTRQDLAWSTVCVRVACASLGLISLFFLGDHDLLICALEAIC